MPNYCLTCAHSKGKCAAARRDTALIRFIILANGRSGTTLVANGLADHPQVLVYGELFHRDPVRRADDASRRTIGAGVWRRLPQGVAACGETEDGAAYVARLFAQAPGAYRAIGFKLGKGHAREGASNSVWPYLASLRSLRVVHIQRANWLATLISRERAVRTRVWHTPTPPRSQPFRLDPELCRRHFERLETNAALAAPLLEQRPVLEVDYDDLSADFSSCMQRIWTFLEADPLHVPSRMSKIAKLEPHEEIVNYDELRKLFRNTPYARFFV